MTVLHFEQVTEGMLAAAAERLEKEVNDHPAEVSDNSLEKLMKSNTCQAILFQALDFLRKDPDANVYGVLAAMLHAGIELGLNAHGES